MLVDSNNKDNNSRDSKIFHNQEGNDTHKINQKLKLKDKDLKLFQAKVLHLIDLFLNFQ